jgi:hypothetical protein
MRLINAKTLELEEFTDKNIPPYSILSHTWGPARSEISFQEFQSLSPGMRDRSGYAKITNCCAQALRDGLNWAWVDTCCIDKSSSAELSENINSMFNYYKRAEKCYAYLADVVSSAGVEDAETWVKAFDESRWFTRGWTVSPQSYSLLSYITLTKSLQLQELIAPKTLEFYSQDWTCIGTKTSLSDSISQITRIPPTILRGGYLPLTSVAARMSWAAGREVTRIEDVAYSLLGIFDVHMPLLYGEGEKAFKRLQQEIMKESDDQSLFAWEYHPHTDPAKRERQTMLGGLLADSPASFANAANIIPFRHAKASEPYTSTNKGIRLNLILLEDQYSLSTGEFTAVLECRTIGPFQGPLGLTLRRTSPRGDQYTRHIAEYTNPKAVSMGKILETTPVTFFVVEKLKISLSANLADQFVLRIHPNCGYHPTQSFPEDGWNAKNALMATNAEGIGILVFENLRTTLFGIPASQVHFVLLFDMNQESRRPEDKCQIYWKARPLRKALEPYHGIYEHLKILCNPKTAGPLTNSKVFSSDEGTVKITCRKGLVFGHDMYIVQVDPNLLMTKTLSWPSPHSQE